MKILSAEQIRILDAYTIRHEPIASIDLMERASRTFVDWFCRQFPEVNRPVVIFCGTGNNGGDGLAVARLLHQRFYDISVYWCRISDKTSEDFAINLGRLPRRQAVTLCELHPGDDFPAPPPEAILVDAIFGSGLNRPVEGYWGAFLSHLSHLPNKRVAIDVPSGLFADKPTTGPTFHADFTFSFELPKLAFFSPENNRSIGQWQVGSIGLDASFIDQLPTSFHYLDAGAVRPLIRPRLKYDHKGSYGHALLLMGSVGSIGAAVLSARACLRSGTGLVTVHAPRCGYEILQGSVPEAMVSIDRHQFQLSEIPDLDRYNAIGVGCGLGQYPTTVAALRDLFARSRQPLVIDADAINILARQKDAFALIPHGSILTPHPKEFERLFGSSPNFFAQNDLQRKCAQELGVYILLKRAHTAIACPDGSCYFNATGNPGMATGGSGDVLTGIITGLLAQGYSARDASLLGVYLHGLAGDKAAAKLGQEAVVAGDIIRHLGQAFQTLKS